MNPQIGKAVPIDVDDNSPAPGVVHSRQVFFFGVDGAHPFANTQAVATAAGDSTVGLLHYNGTLFQVGTAAEFEEGASITFYDAGMAAMTVPEAVQHMADRINGVGNPALLAVRGTSFWPWTARAVQQLTPFGDLWWSLEIIRGYPAGTPGTEASRPVPIIGHMAGANVVLPPEIPSDGGNNLLGISLTYFYPGERHWDLLPARFSKANRAVLPLGPGYNGGDIVIVPFEPVAPL